MADQRDQLEFQVATKSGGAFGQTALPVWPNAHQLDTYGVGTTAVVAVAAASVQSNIFSIEHALASTKTVRIRRVLVGGFVSTASAANAGQLTLELLKGTAASSGGAAVTAEKAHSSSPTAEAVVKQGPTIVTTATRFVNACTFGTGAAGATVGTNISGNMPILLYDWQENGETVPLTLRAGVLESLTLAAVGSWTTTGPSITFGWTVIFTEE